MLRYLPIPILFACWAAFAVAQTVPPPTGNTHQAYAPGDVVRAPLPDLSADWASKQDFPIPAGAIPAPFSNLNAPWVAFTPTAFCSTGTLTSYAAGGRYMQVNKTVMFWISVQITTNGTCAGFVGATLPPFAARSVVQAFGRENAVVGKMLQAISSAPGATNLAILNYDNTYPGSDGAALVITGIYEAQ